MNETDARLEIFERATLDIAGQACTGQFEKSDGIDELVDQAEVYGLMAHVGQPEIERLIGEAFKQAEEEQAKHKNNGKGKTNGKAHEPALLATPYSAPDPAQMPRRSWMHGGHYIREVATATVAPGGSGKTTLALYEALLMVRGGLCVWYISGEDPKTEIDRRIAAHCQHHGWLIKDFSGRLYIDDKASFPLFIARSPRAATVLFDERMLTQFEAAIVADTIDVVILDPFVSFHAVPENDNGAIDAVCKRLAGISYRTHCCIEISHHVRKQAPGQTAITVDDTRGGGAIVNAVRSSRVINRMSNAEAERAKIMPDQRSSYIRLDRGKRNMAPPDAANWYHIVSVDLPNGDNVQSLEEWEFPKAKEATAEDCSWVRSMVSAKKYRVDPRAKEWLGKELIKRFGLSAQSKSDIKWVKKVLGDWVDDDVLGIEEAEDSERHFREFYCIGGTSPPTKNVDLKLWENEDYDGE